MRRQITGLGFTLAAGLVLGACASPPPARQISDREISDFLSGYVRVVSKSNGQELFCSPVHFRLGTCYTRAQMQERLLASLRAGPVMMGGWGDGGSDSSFTGTPGR